MSEAAGTAIREVRSTRKKDNAPRGVFRHPSGVWAVRFTCGLGCIHQEKVNALKSDAVELYHERRKRARGEPGWCPKAERRAAVEAKRREEEARHLQDAQAVTVRQYAEHWLLVHVAQDCRERTARGYRAIFERHIFPALGDVPLGGLTRPQLKGFLASKAEAGLTRGTLKNIVVPLRAMLNAAVDEGRISGTPAARLLKRVRGRTEAEARKALSAPELARVLEAADKYFPDYADFVYLLAWTGLRLSEACGLQWGDLDLAGGFLEVRRTASYRAHRILIGAPKSGKARRVDLPAALGSRLRARQSLREAEAALQGRDLSPWVFPCPDRRDQARQRGIHPLQGLVQAAPAGRAAGRAPPRPPPHLRKPPPARWRADDLRQGAARPFQHQRHGGSLRARPAWGEPGGRGQARGGDGRSQDAAELRVFFDDRRPASAGNGLVRAN